MSSVLTVGRPVAVDAASSSRTATYVRLSRIAVCLLALVLGGAHLTNEGYVSTQGDMPRYLMNAVYFLDLLRDRPFAGVDEFMEYTQLYYARYPALSLGHHPPLLSVLTVPLFWMFGVSITAGRVVVLGAFVASVAFVHLLVEALYGWRAALLSAAFVATSALTIELGQSVLAEVPAVALLCAAVYALHRFVVSGRRAALVWFVATAAMSVYAKQLTAFVFPAFLVMALTRLGWRRTLSRDVIIAGGVLVALVVPMAIVSVYLSPSNVMIAGRSSAHAFEQVSSLVPRALEPQFGRAVWWLAAAGLVLGVARRDRFTLVAATWMLCVFLGMMVVGRHDPPRFTVYWVPAIAIMAGSVVSGWRRGALAWAVTACVTIVMASQMVASASVGLPGAGGYEAAARFVLASEPGPTVLFSGDIDTGFFSFFVRKHQPARQLVVLRADKLLTTSFLARPDLQDRIHSPAEIYDMLHRFGTRLIVIEDRPSRSPVLEWLRREVRSNRFVERTRIPFVTDDVRLRGVDLVVYEFVDATPPDAAAVLSMNLPLAHRSLEVKLSDLIARKHLR